jgi:hypothetical protein
MLKYMFGNPLFGMQKQSREKELEQIVEQKVVLYVKDLLGIQDDPLEVDVLLAENVVLMIFDDPVGAYEPHEKDINVLFTKGRKKTVGSVELTDFVHVLPKELQQLPIFEGFLPVS